MIHFKLTVHEEYVCEYVSLCLCECLWVCVCVCVCTRTHMCMYVCVYMNVCACACISLCLHKGYGSLCKDYSYDCSLVEEILRLSSVKSGLRGSWISNNCHLD